MKDTWKEEGTASSSGNLPKMSEEKCKVLNCINFIWLFQSEEENESKWEGKEIGELDCLL